MFCIEEELSQWVCKGLFGIQKENDVRDVHEGAYLSFCSSGCGRERGGKKRHQSEKKHLNFFPLWGQFPQSKGRHVIYPRIKLGKARSHFPDLPTYTFHVVWEQI